MKAELGLRLRAARSAHGDSLRAVAAAVGISPSMLSQVENGKILPSVATLYAIVSHLGVSVDDVLTPQADSGPRRPVASGTASKRSPATNPIIEMSGGVRWERLPADVPGVTLLLATYRAGSASSTDEELVQHAGDEVAYLLEGQLTLLLEDERHVLTAGDSIGFSSRRRHLYRNETNTVARGVWMVIDHGQHGDPGNARKSQIKSAVDVLAAMRRDDA